MFKLHHVILNLHSSNLGATERLVAELYRRTKMSNILACTTLVHQHGGQKTKAQIKPDFHQIGQI